MSVIDDMESVQKEIRELILHSKSKRCTVFEPCSEENLSKCMKSIEEELSVLGVKYMFNQYEDLDPTNLTKTMVRLTNGTWGLIMHHKEVAANGQKLKDRNYALQQNNFFLNDMVDKQKKELDRRDCRLKQATEDTRQMVLKMEASQQAAGRAAEEARRAKSQLATREHELCTQVRRAELELSRLKERFLGANGIYVTKSQAKENFMEECRAKEKKYKEIIAKLQENNRQLIQEVINLKEELMEEATAEVSDG